MFFNPFKELAEFGEWVCRVATCALCTGPIMIIVGIALLSSSSNDTRTTDVNKYNDFSSSWVASKRSLFLNKTYAITSAGGSLVLSAETSGDVYSDSIGLNLPNATVRYTKQSTANMPFSSSIPYTIGSTTYTSNFKFFSNGALIQDLSSLPVAGELTSSISCSNSDSYTTCANRCSGGVYTQSPSQCRSFYVISEICLVVDPLTNQLDTTGGSGCAIPDGSSSLPSQFKSDYKNNLARASYAKFSSSVVPTSLTNVNPRVTIRSKDDPYVAYLRLTDGTRSFGLTTAQKVASGMAILGIGIAITVVVCGAIFYMIKCMRRPNTQGTVLSSQPPPSAGQIMMMPQQQQQMMFANPQPQLMYAQQPQPQMGYPAVMAKDQPQVMISPGGGGVPQGYGFYPPPQPQMMMVVAPQQLPQQQPMYAVPQYPQQQQQPQGGVYPQYPQQGQYPPTQGTYPQQGQYPQQYPQQYPPQQ